MSPPYVPGHIIDEAKDRRRQGDSLEGLASRIGITPEDLATLLGEPQAKPIPASEPKADEFDLFASERLDGVL